MAAKPRPGSAKSNCYDQTKKLILTVQERTAGWVIDVCINCEQGKRRVMATCELCGGQGLIKMFNGDAFEGNRPGRPRKKKGRAA